MIGAGQLDRVATFQMQNEASDGGGGVAITWANQFRRYAHLAQVAPRAADQAIAGGVEEVLARAILTVRDDSQTRQIGTDWRVEIGGQVWSIREAQPLAVRGLRRFSLQLREGES